MNLRRNGIMWWCLVSCEACSLLWTVTGLSVWVTNQWQCGCRRCKVQRAQCPRQIDHRQLRLQVQVTLVNSLVPISTDESLCVVVTLPIVGSSILRWVLSVWISQEPHIDFTGFPLHVACAVTCSFYGGVVICYVLRVLWMMSCFPTMSL